MASGLSSPGYDRVIERRRAVALAHFREAEGLSIAEIAERFGRSPTTIKADFYDPTGEKARAVKRRYQGVCRGSGAPTAARNGKGDAYQYCKPCHPGGDRGTTNARLGARCDSRVARGLRTCAIINGLVADARPNTSRRSAATTARRRLACAIHGHRSVRHVGRRASRRLH